MDLDYTPRWTRVDPTTCGCTSCIVGRSIPLGDLSPDDKDWISRQMLDNASDATGLSERGWDAVLTDDVHPADLRGKWWAWVD